MGKTEGVIRARFRTEEDLDEFVDFYKGETYTAPLGAETLG